MSKATDAPGITVCFIDGKHEDHENLEFHANLHSPVRGPVEPVEMHPSLWYLPQGCWHRLRFRASGGAFSVDQLVRILGNNWFPTEEAPST